jgi:hypothetical protein
LHAISAVAGSSLIGVMLVDIHWPVPRIGFILNIVGPAAAVAASFAAGWIFARFARQASLLTMMVIQAVLNLALIPLAADGYQATVAETVVVMLVVASSIANLIIKTVAMDKSAATDDKGTYFSLQGSMSQAGGLVALVAAPAAAQFVGYVPVIFFGLVSGLASAAILLTGSKAPAVAAPTRG